MKRFLFFSVLSLFCLTISAQSWDQIGADIPGAGIDDRSGASVSLSDDGLTMAIGSPFNADNGPNVGHVRIFIYDGSSWILKGNPIEGNSKELGFGISVGLSADANRVAVSASYGKTRVYDWNGTLWQQVGNSIDIQSLSVTTGSVAISGNGKVVGVGDLGNTTTGSGAGQVRLYTLSGNTWQQKGSSINGSINGLTGSALSISYDGNTFATNLKKDIQVYSWNSTAWVFKGNAMNAFPAEKVSLSSDGNIIAISGFNAIGQTDGKGIAQVYQWNGTSWDPKGNAVHGDLAQSYFGWSLSLSKNGQVMAVGTPQGALLIGQIKVFVQTGNNWEQTGNTLFGKSNDRLGHAISLNGTGNILGVGLPNTLYYFHAGMMDKSRVFRNNEVLGVADSKRLKIAIYPNPTDGKFSIEFGNTQESVTVRILSLIGQLIVNKQFQNTNPIELEITQPSGLYLLQISDNQGRKTLFKIVKE